MIIEDTTQPPKSILKMGAMRLISILTAATIAPMAVQSLSARPLKVTVFGGTGYVGSAVCERLIKRGHEVTAVSRRGENPKPDSTELSQVRDIFV